MIKIKFKDSHQQLQTTSFGSVVITTDSVDGLPSGTPVLILSEGVVPLMNQISLIEWTEKIYRVQCRPLFKNEIIEITNE